MKIFFWIIAALYSSVSIASSTGAGILSMVHIMPDGVVLVNTSASRTLPFPDCGKDQPARFAVNGTTPGGKLQAAGLLAANMARRSVVIVGTGECGAYGGTETIHLFYTPD